MADGIIPRKHRIPSRENPKPHHPPILFRIRLQVGVGGFILPALQTQTNPQLYPDTVIVIECLNGNTSTIDLISNKG